MPRMTLGELTSQVRDYISNKPMDKIARGANMTLREIGRYLGPVERSTLTVRGVYQGTDAAIGQGGISFSSPASAFSDAGESNQIIRIAGDDTWFNIAKVPSATSLELSSAWIGPTMTSGVFTIAYPLQPFPDNVLEIINIGKEGRSPFGRIGSDHEFLDEYRIEPRDHVQSYIQRAHGYNGRLTIQWQPPWLATNVVQYTYRKKPLYYDTEDEQSVCDFPDIYSDAILYGTLHLMWDQEDAQDRSQYWFQKYSRALSEIMAQDIVRSEGQYERARVSDAFSVRAFNKTPIQ